MAMRERFEPLRTPRLFLGSISRAVACAIAKGAVGLLRTGEE